MCGIAGIWNYSEPDSVDRMVSAMHHRGPDDHGVYHDTIISFGMARLAIIDTSQSGHQPMSTPDGKIWIVFNGEIYNYQEERTILESQGISFSSSSDTEVLLRMYELYGDDLLCRLRGIFAIAIYDIRRGKGHERLLLARDHFGIKPLLYTKVHEMLIFASEIKAILASGCVNPIIDQISLYLLLTFGSINQPQTIIQNVKMLLPAHRMIIEAGKPERIERFWTLSTDRYQGLRLLPYEKQVGILKSTLEKNIQMQMISDVPLGAFLSGGVDSSILVAMMTQFSDHRIKTFSVGFESEGADIDESEDARKTAEHIGTDHTHVLVKGSDLSSNIRHIARGLDQPTVDGVNTYFVSKAARKEVTVAISGTGGDEMFAGYPWFLSMARYQNHKGILHALKRKVVKSAKLSSVFLRSGFHQGWKQSIQNGDPDGFATRYASHYLIFGSDEASDVLFPSIRKDIADKRSEYQYIRHCDEIPHGSAIERVSGLVLRGYTNNQLLRDIDVASMSHSLEVRVPYLDPVIADLALSLPDSAKLGDPETITPSSSLTYRSSGAKRILIDVGREFLPKDFDLQPKRGFAMPFDTWLRGPLNPVFEDALSGKQIKERSWFDGRKVETLKKQFYDRKKSWAQPWLLMMLELWGREVLDPCLELWVER